MPRLVMVIFLLIAAGVFVVLMATDEEPVTAGPGEDAPAIDMDQPTDRSTPEVSPGTQPVTRPGPDEVTIPEGEQTPDVGTETPRTQEPDPAEGEEAAEDEPTGD